MYAYIYTDILHFHMFFTTLWRIWVSFSRCIHIYHTFWYLYVYISMTYTLVYAYTHTCCHKSRQSSVCVCVCVATICVYVKNCWLHCNVAACVHLLLLLLLYLLLVLLFFMPLLIFICSRLFLLFGLTPSTTKWSHT